MKNVNGTKKDMFGNAYFAEYRMIGSISQYLLHCPVEDAPVLLFLHGGPGSAESNFSYQFRHWWGDLFTIVQWDQRGSGKTLHKNPDTAAYPLTLEALLEDMREIITYLKERYQQRKIVLMGHSWGTVLGSLYALQHPEDVALYIGVGQVVNMVENERAGFAKAMEAAQREENARDVKKLNAVGSYPPSTLDKAGIRKISAVRKVQQKYGLAAGFTRAVVSMFCKSPVFQFSDIGIMLYKAIKANLPLLNDLLGFDLETVGFTFKMPVCCIQGEHDFQTPTPLAVAYFEKVQAPAKQVHIVEGAGHNTPIDQPYRFADALTEAREMLDLPDCADGS